MKQIILAVLFLIGGRVFAQDAPIEPASKASGGTLTAGEVNWIVNSVKQKTDTTTVYTKTRADNKFTTTTQLSDSLENLSYSVDESNTADSVMVVEDGRLKVTKFTLSVDEALSADSILVMQEGKLKIMSKQELFADIYSALKQIQGIDINAPTVDSLVLGILSDSTIVVYLGGGDVMPDSIPLTTDFSLTEGGGIMGINSVSLYSDSLVMVLDSVAEYGLTYLLDYTRGFPALQDSSQNKVSSFSDRYVTSYLTAPEVPSSFNAKYQAVYDQMTIKPGADTATIFNHFVYRWDSAGFWNRTDRLWFFAQKSNTNGEAFIDWIHPTGERVTDGNSTTFTKYEGFTGDGGTDWLNLGFNPTTEGVNYALNSGTLGFYNRVVRAFEKMGGVYYSGTYSEIHANTNSTISYRINTSTASTTGTLPENTYMQGLIIATRTGATSTELYRRGVSVHEDVSTSTSVPNFELGALARNNSSGATDFSVGQLSLAFIMNGVTDADVTLANKIIEDTMDALGKGVQ